VVCAILAVVNEAFSTSEQSCIYVCIPSVVCAILAVVMATIVHLY